MELGIFCDDSLDAIKKLPDKCVDVVITDPPYIVDTSKCRDKHKWAKRLSKLQDKPTYDKGKWGINCGKLRSNEVPNYVKQNHNEAIEQDNIGFMSQGFDIDAHLSEWDRVCKIPHFFIFCSNKQISKLMRWGEDRGYITTLLVWNKPDAPPLCNGNWISDIEYVVHIRGRRATFQGDNTIKRKVHIVGQVRSKYDHPTVKPLELIKKYIQISTNENDIVLDPFCGSGTTAHACIHLNRKYLCYEILDKYYQVAKQRELEALGKTGLFT